MPIEPFLGRFNLLIISIVATQVTEPIDHMLSYWKSTRDKLVSRQVIEFSICNIHIVIAHA